MNLEILGLILLIIVLNTLLSPFSKTNALYCGIVGFSGENKYDLLKIKFLLYWNSIERGTDSTGIYIPEMGIVKNNTRAEYFINDKKYMDKLVSSDTLIAHVRAKTVGANTMLNAHPFKYGRIIGVHNGSLKNHLKLCSDYNFKTIDYDVDSQVLISAMNKNFDEYEDINRFKVLEQYEGAAALLFYDEWEDSLYACHDKERPLFYGYLNEGKDMYISSIKDTLEAIECENITSFPINIVHKIKAGKIIETFSYKPYVSPFVVNKTLVIASFNDIKKDPVSGIITLPKFCKGIISSIAKGIYFKGFWIQLDSTTNNLKGKFTYGKWYFCDDVVETSNGYTDKLLVYDDVNEKNELTTININTSNFIPVVDDYVKLTFTINDKKKKKIADSGDLCVVKEYNYGDKTLTVHRVSDNKPIYLYSECVRNLTYIEREDAIKEVNKINEANKKSEQITLFKNLLLDSPKETEESPFVESPIVDLTEDDFEDITEEDLLIPGSEGYVDADTYAQVILGAIESAEEIQCCLTLGQVDKAYKEINEMVDNLKKLFANINDEIVV